MHPTVAVRWPAWPAPPWNPASPEVLSDPIFAVRIEEVLPGLPERLLPPRPGAPPLVPLVPLSGQSIAADTLWFY
jgi:hypothetical protein